MDELTQALLSTTSPDDDTRKRAETYLDQVQKQPGCGAALLNAINDNKQPTQVRQAASILLKNLIGRHWDEREFQKDHYVIPDAERPDLRQRVFETTVHAPAYVREQLAVCLQRMVGQGFREHWAGIDQAVCAFLESHDPNLVMGALTVCYAFTRKFRMRKREHKEPYFDFLAAIAGSLNNAVTFLMSNMTDENLISLRFVIKIYHNSGLMSMPPVYATAEACDHWTGLMLNILQLSPPAPPADTDKSEWPMLPFWKVQKWATKNLEIFFERYGLPKQCDKDMREYAQHYIDTWACHVLESLMRVLGSSFQQYVSPRVVRNCLRYMSHAVESSTTWKFMKPHLNELMDSILFPLMCFSDDDEQLWQEDPYEYVRKCYAIDANFTDPVAAASYLIENLIEKRTKATLEPTVSKCMAVAQSVPGSADYNPRHKDGALLILSSIADTIMERKKYARLMEDFIVQCVLPETESPQPFMHRRVCCFIDAYSEHKFESVENLERVLYAVLSCLKSTHIPVSVAAAIAMQQLLEFHEHMRPYIDDELSWIIGKLLELLRETDNDDLTDVMARMIEIYADKLAPYGIALAEELARAFERLRHYDPTNEADQHKVLAAQGVMESIRNISDIFETQAPEQRAQFESHVIEVVRTILLTPVTDFVEDAVELVVSCTTTTISPTMWTAFDIIFESLKNGYIEYFPEVMPPLFNFIRNGANVFVEDGSKLEMLFETVKSVWTDDEVDDTLCYVAKLMELMMTYLGSSQLMARCVEPFLELVVTKLMEDPEEQPLALRAQCVNVFIAGLCYNVTEVLGALEQAPGPDQQPLSVAIIKMWFSIAEDINDWHNRRTNILGLCSLLQAPLDQLPPSVQQAWPHILPMLMHMFNGLKEAYERERQDSDDEDEDEEDGDGDSSRAEVALSALAAEQDDDADGLKDDEDYDSQPLHDLLTQIAKQIQEQERVVVDDSGEWAGFDTPYDEEDTYDVYVIVRDTLQGLHTRDPAAYEALFTKPEQREQVTQLSAEAQERERKKAEEKAAEQQQQQQQQHQHQHQQFS